MCPEIRYFVILQNCLCEANIAGFNIIFDHFLVADSEISLDLQVLLSHILQNKDSKEEVNGINEHSTATRVGLSNKVKINNSLDRPKGSNTHRDQSYQDGDKTPKVETKRREFKFRKNHELLNHKEKEIMQDFIDKSPEKIHPSQLCPEVKLETLSPELKLMAEKSHTITETASQPTTRLTTSRSRKKLNEDFMATCPKKRKEMNTRSKLSLKRRKYEDQESVRKVSELIDNENSLSETDVTQVRKTYFKFACVPV